MKKTTPMRAIRAKCVDCSGGSTLEVKECPVKDCSLFIFRLGKNPNRPARELSPEQRAAVKIRLCNMRKNRKAGA